MLGKLLTFLVHRLSHCLHWSEQLPSSQWCRESSDLFGYPRTDSIAIIQEKLKIYFVPLKTVFFFLWVLFSVMYVYKRFDISMTACYITKSVKPPRTQS